MKILQTQTAPNPRRVRIFLAEKGIEVPFEELDLMKGALKTPEFTKLNRFQRVPVLVLDDGTAIAETMAICRYFEETQAGAGAVRQGRAGSGPWWRCGTGAWSSGCCSAWPRRSATCIRPWPSSRCRRWRPGARPTSPGRWRSCSSWTRSWASGRFIAGDDLLGRRHHGAGGRRLHAGRRASSGPPELKNLDALARGGVGPAERQGLSAAAAVLGTDRPAAPPEGCTRCHETDGCRLRRCVRLRRAAADLLSRRDGRHALPDRLRRHRADRPQPARLDPNAIATIFISHLHGDHYRGPGVVAAPRPACGQAHRAADGRRPRRHRGAVQGGGRGPVSGLHRRRSAATS